MAKAIALLLALAMLVQFIRPLNLPGLRRRRDACKLAALGIVVFAVTAAVRPG